MSKIVIMSQKTDAPGAVLMSIKKATGRSVSDSKTAIEGGIPFYDAVLFENDHQSVDSALISVLDTTEAAGIPLDVYELEPDETFESAPLEECHISPEILRNILTEARGQFS